MPYALGPMAEFIQLLEHGLRQLFIDPCSFIALVGLDERVKAGCGFAVARNHYRRNTFLLIQGVNEWAEVATDDDKIRPGPIKTEIVGKNLLLAKLNHTDR